MTYSSLRRPRDKRDIPSYIRVNDDPDHDGGDDEDDEITTNTQNYHPTNNVNSNINSVPFRRNLYFHNINHDNDDACDASVSSHTTFNTMYTNLTSSLHQHRAPKMAALLLIIFVTASMTQFVLYLFRVQTNIAMNEYSQNGQFVVRHHRPFGNQYNNTMLQEFLSKPVIDTSNPDVPLSLPSELNENLVNILEKPQPNTIPLFWHVPRSGGSTLKDIVSFCYLLTQASEVGGSMDPVLSHANELKIIMDTNSGAKFMNVDTTSIPGIQRAKDLDLTSFPDLHLVVTPYIHDAAVSLFNPNHQGRMFTLLRHPLERAVSMYYYLKNHPAYRGDYNLGDTIEMYAKSPMVENNWMTRFLSNRMGGELTPYDEAVAKEVLRTKCLIGLLRRKTESLRRFETFFDWDTISPGSHDRGKKEECEDKLLNWGWSGMNPHPPIDENGEVWNLLLKQNTFDMRVYEYAEQLFEAQSIFFMKE